MSPYPGGSDLYGGENPGKWTVEWGFLDRYEKVVAK